MGMFFLSEIKKPHTIFAATNANSALKSVCPVAAIKQVNVHICLFFAH